MENKTKTVNTLNSAVFQFKKLSELEENKTYKIISFESLPGKYGTQLIAILEHCKVSLPQRYEKFIPQIEELNLNPPSLKYKGKISFRDKQMHDIEFV